MKKVLLLALALALFCSEPALAEIDAPALKNPQERYDWIMDSTDGSEQLVFMLLDSANDEQESIDRFGRLTTHMAFVDDNGKTVFVNSISQQVTDAGNVQIIYTSMYEDVTMYTTPYATVKWESGRIADITAGQDKESFDWTWESYRFPFATLTRLMGTRGDGAEGEASEYAYYLIFNEYDNYVMEFAAEGMAIEQLRIYMQNGDDWVLSIVVTHEEGEALEIPEEVLRALKDAAPESGERPA